MARLVEDDLRSYYHCVSPVVDGRYIFGDEEKRFFRKTMRGLEHLTGVRILIYCLMSNHSHLLLEVPRMQRFGQARKSRTRNCCP